MFPLFLLRYFPVPCFFWGGVPKKRLDSFFSAELPTWIADVWKTIQLNSEIPPNGEGKQVPKSLRWNLFKESLSKRDLFKNVYCFLFLLIHLYTYIVTLYIYTIYFAHPFPFQTVFFLLPTPLGFFLTLRVPRSCIVHRQSPGGLSGLLLKIILFGGWFAERYFEPSR